MPSNARTTHPNLGQNNSANLATYAYVDFLATHFYLIFFIFPAKICFAHCIPIDHNGFFISHDMQSI